MVEYGLVIGMIAVLVIGAFLILGTGMVERQGVIDKAIGSQGVGEGQASLSAATYG